MAAVWRGKPPVMPNRVRDRAVAEAAANAMIMTRAGVQILNAAKVQPVMVDGSGKVRLDVMAVMAMRQPQDCTELMRLWDGVGGLQIAVLRGEVERLALAIGTFGFQGHIWCRPGRTLK